MLKAPLNSNQPTNLGQSDDVRQAADPAVDVVLEDVAEVGDRAAAVADHRVDAVAAQENLDVALDGTDERLVRRNVQLAVHKRLHTSVCKTAKNPRRGKPSVQRQGDGRDEVTQGKRGVASTACVAGQYKVK